MAQGTPKAWQGPRVWATVVTCPFLPPEGLVSQNIRIGFAVHFGEQINLFLYLTIVKSFDFLSHFGSIIPKFFYDLSL